MTIYCTVTNDLVYDQRMQRICSSLATAGHQVVLIGRKMKQSIPLTAQPFHQKRLGCFFQKGKLFYAEYNIRLFIFLLFKKMDCICAIDLDTILPCLFISRLKRIKRVYDAHELFCEMKEIVTRPAIQRFWKMIERYSVPKFRYGYTVNEPIAAEFEKMYGVQYAVIRNVPVLMPAEPVTATEKFILYQGAVNEGRCFETLIPAMQWVPCRLIICGDGNFMAQAITLVQQYQLEEKVIFRGQLSPAALRQITQQAYIGINLVESTGKSNYLSLANKFFDYIHAGVPQLTMDYPAYASINRTYEVALLITDISAENIARQLNNLLRNEVVYSTLRQNCVAAREIYNWQQEEKLLLNLYKQIEHR
ncbi:MAG TPA: glycosyltransferase family 4 protein [Ferruginibacter sp.]|nr:glycosyltransferase family 4 protein [Ferruginibacter sp.]HMP22422.1 glycosyltransferase family 4 protein [Ferruginibacter sp.]